MYDRETGSLWSHITGQAIAGPMKGKKLRILAGMPSVTWSAWRSLHPRTLALSVDGREDLPVDRYAGYERSPTQTGLFPLRRPDNRLQAKELIIGVSLGQESRAYPHALLRRQGLITDRIGQTQILVFLDSHTGATAVYRAPDDGPFRLEQGLILGPGGKWQAATGRSVAGERDLTAVPYTNAYWFGWVSFYPHASVYR